MIARRGFAGLVRRLLARPAPAMADVAEPGVLLVPDGGVIHRVSVAEIDWAAAAGNYVEIGWGTRTLLHRATLAGLEARLGRGFARIHRGRLVRRAAVAKVETGRSGDFTVTLTGGQSLRGSRRFRARLGG
ncbi:LytR/AlgR family response regulator transcription factor [Sphingomonas canadensis]|uniref:LytR/AlgR family response regulator transcription factor n=1 Tax=Sphingomonas canadensis TaxID=1219257 RepID=A0ABW3HAY0_9SPHN|nr:LytTR family DNA-binding domain-containing protein [Sphingomonas canadensis]MCW3836622.1 LytTR family transcriptional regulator [Sphingomonas canadensis]